MSSKKVRTLEQNRNPIYQEWQVVLQFVTHAPTLFLCWFTRIEHSLLGIGGGGTCEKILLIVHPHPYFVVIIHCEKSKP